MRTAQRYPDPLRRVHYFDAERDSRLTFLMQGKQMKLTTNSSPQQQKQRALAESAKASGGGDTLSEGQATPTKPKGGEV